MKHIAILGSTGSIGRQTLEVVRSCGGIRVESLAVHSDIDLLEQQIREFHPRLVSVWDPDRALELQTRIAGSGTEVLSGLEGLTAAACIPEAEIVVTAVVGMIGIRPTIAAIRAGKDIALANKETLVCAGHLIMPLAREYGVKILPVDSEHSAIFQCLQGNADSPVEKILLTASGGPFRGYTREQLSRVTLEDALRHPNWSMGPKITIDSSTMANKGLEVMEACWLFSVRPSQVQVVIQPQSIIHSMVQFADGAVLAQLGTPDMKLPIQYALTWPLRRPMAGERLDFTKITSIVIERPDPETFPALRLALEAAETGGSMPVVFNAANEYAVGAFLDRKISYLQIPAWIEQAMKHHTPVPAPSVEEILEVQKETERILELDT